MRSLLLAVVCALIGRCAATDPVFDKEFVQTAIESAELSILVKKETAGESSDKFDYYAYFADTESSNRVLVAKQNGVCYGAFRSKMIHPLQLFIKRIMAFIAGNYMFFDDVCDGQECCRVRTPLYEQFFFMPYLQEAKEAMSECVATCEGSGCPLILTGHAAGGAVAHLAGIELSDLNPTGFTYGSPEIIHAEGCSLLDSSKWYRFVNSAESPHRREWGYPKGGLVYDFIPLAYDRVANKSYLAARHIGHFLILSYDYTIANLGLDATKHLITGSRGAGAMTIPDSDRYTRGYLDRLVTLYSAFSIIGFPVPPGYASRDLCTVDGECAGSMVCSKECLVCPPRCDAPSDKRTLRS